MLQDQVIQLVYAIDTDNDGCISYEEFLTIVEQGKGTMAEMKMLAAQQKRKFNEENGAAYLKGDEVAALSVCDLLQREHDVVTSSH